jgi:hypothetical protein
MDFFGLKILTQEEIGVDVEKVIWELHVFTFISDKFRIENQLLTTQWKAHLLFLVCIGQSYNLSVSWKKNYVICNKLSLNFVFYINIVSCYVFCMGYIFVIGRSRHFHVKNCSSVFLSRCIYIFRCLLLLYRLLLPLPLLYSSNNNVRIRCNVLIRGHG